MIGMLQLYSVTYTSGFPSQITPEQQRIHESASLTQDKWLLNRIPCKYVSVASNLSCLGKSPNVRESTTKRQTADRR